jgi:hypothetical protein
MRLTRRTKPTGYLISRSISWTASGRGQAAAAGHSGIWATDTSDVMRGTHGTGQTRCSACAIHTCVPDPLQVYLVNKALVSGKEHKGMPAWPAIVERIGILLADPEHPAWYQDGRGAQALSEIPRQALPIERLTSSLLTEPSTLPVEVLEWLSRHFLYCAGPPFGSPWPDRRER